MKKFFMKIKIFGAFQCYCKPPRFIGKNRLYYETFRCPTQSAVVGIIGCALGIPRAEQDKLHALYESLDIKYKTLNKGDIITDDQILNRDDEKIFKTCEYLTSYEFDVYIGAENEEMLKKITNALLHPIYPYYLGKSNCIPGKCPIQDDDRYSLYDLDMIEGINDCPHTAFYFSRKH